MRPEPRWYQNIFAGLPKVIVNTLIDSYACRVRKASHLILNYRFCPRSLLLSAELKAAKEKMLQRCRCSPQALADQVYIYVSKWIRNLILRLTLAYLARCFPAVGEAESQCVS